MTNVDITFAKLFTRFKGQKNFIFFFFFLQIIVFLHKSFYLVETLVFLLHAKFAP